MIVQTNAVKNARHVKNNAHRNVLIRDAHRNVERFVTNVQSLARLDASTMSAASFVLKFATENLVSCLVKRFWIVVIPALDFVEKLARKYAEKKNVRITINQHLKFCLEWKMTLMPDL